MRKSELQNAERIVSHNLGKLGVTYTIKIKGEDEPKQFYRSNVVQYCKAMTDAYDQNHPEIRDYAVLKRKGRGSSMKAKKGRRSEEAPAAKEEAPAAKEEAPAVKEEAPATKEEAPAVKEEAPATKEEAPAVKEEAPAVKEEAPADKRRRGPNQNVSSSGKNSDSDESKHDELNGESSVASRMKKRRRCSDVVPKDASGHSSNVQEAERNEPKGDSLDAPPVKKSRRGNVKPKEASAEVEVDNEDDADAEAQENGILATQMERTRRTADSDGESSGAESEPNAEALKSDNVDVPPPVKKERSTSPEEESSGEDDIQIIEMNSNRRTLMNSKEEPVEEDSPEPMGNDEPETKHDASLPEQLQESGEPVAVTANDSDNKLESVLAELRQMDEEMGHDIKEFISLSRSLNMEKGRIDNQLIHLKASSATLRRDLEKVNMKKDNMIHRRERVQMMLHRYSTAQ